MSRVVIAIVALVAACRFGFDVDRDATIGDDDTSCPDCSWRMGAFGVCSDTCTTGTQTRVVECHDASEKLRPDDKCPGEKPAPARACEETGCAWAPGAWAACSVGCGGGTSDRPVECKTTSGLVAPDTYCDVTTQPAASQACNTAACCMDLGNTITELPHGPLVCMGASQTRYMINPDVASMTERCTELGYDGYGGTYTPFTQATWCMYCNARTKLWDGTAWVENGCNIGVTTLRCCDNP